MTKPKYDSVSERKAAMYRVHEGNSYTKKFQSEEERELLRNQYFEHRANGFTKDSFPGCALSTWNRLVKEYPLEFTIDFLESAEQAYKTKWQELLMGNVSGKIRGQVAGAIFALKAQAGWQDKQQQEVRGKLEISWGTAKETEQAE